MFESLFGSCPYTDDLIKCTAYQNSDKKFPCFMTATGCRKRNDDRLDECRRMLYTVENTNDCSLRAEIKEKLSKLKEEAQKLGADGLIYRGEIIEMEKRVAALPTAKFGRRKKCGKVSKDLLRRAKRAGIKVTHKVGGRRVYKTEANLKKQLRCSSFGRKRKCLKKVSKDLLRRAKRAGIKVTRKVGGKRVYKTEAAIKKQLKCSSFGRKRKCTPKPSKAILTKAKNLGIKVTRKVGCKRVHKTEEALLKQINKKCNSCSPVMAPRCSPAVPSYAPMAPSYAPSYASFPATPPSYPDNPPTYTPTYNQSCAKCPNLEELDFGRCKRRKSPCRRRKSPCRRRKSPCRRRKAPCRRRCQTPCTPAKPVSPLPKSAPFKLHTYKEENNISTGIFSSIDLPTSPTIIDSPDNLNTINSLIDYNNKLIQIFDNNKKFFDNNNDDNTNIFYEKYENNIYNIFNKLYTIFITNGNIDEYITYLNENLIIIYTNNIVRDMTQYVTKNTIIINNMTWAQIKDALVVYNEMNKNAFKNFIYDNIMKFIMKFINNL